MDRLTITIATSFIIFRSFVLGIFEEPVCSKYHFEEKVLEKLIKLEIQVENELKRLRDEVGAVDAKCSAFANSMKNDVAGLMGNVSKIETMHEAITRDHEVATKEIDGSPKLSIAFTATTPKKKLANNIPVFVTVVTNAGGGYNQKTGRFTCPVSGVYLFSVTLRSTRNYVYCWIQRNGKGIVYAQTPSSDSMTTSTAIATLELSAGDVVNLGNCYNWDDIYTNAGAAFSGVLISH